MTAPKPLVWQAVTVTFPLGRDGSAGPTTITGTALVKDVGLLSFSGLDPASTPGRAITWQAWGETDGAGNFIYGLVLITGAGPGAAIFYSIASSGVDQVGAQNLSVGGASGFSLNRVTIDADTGDATFTAGVSMVGLPNADPLAAGTLWNDAGTVKVSAG